MHFLIVIYMACTILAKWWFICSLIGTSHFDLEGGRSIPALKFVGGAFPLELQISLKKIASSLFEISIDGGLYIYGSIVTL